MLLLMVARAKLAHVHNAKALQLYARRSTKVTHLYLCIKRAVYKRAPFRHDIGAPSTTVGHSLFGGRIDKHLAEEGLNVTLSNVTGRA
jgi:hypothetical protein